MSLTSGELRCIAQQINSRTSRRIEKIFSPSVNEISIIFREEKKLRLHIDCSTYAASIFLTSEKSENPKMPDGFTSLLRKHLSGQRLEVVETWENDRQAAIVFHPTGQRLYCRFFGSGGFLLTEADGTIMANHLYKHNPTLKIGQLFLPDKKEPQSKEQNSQTANLGDNPSDILEQRHSKEQLQGKQKLLTAAIKSEVKKMEKLHRSLTNDMGKLKRFAEGQRFGDLCQTYFHLLKIGMKQITVTDHATGQEVTIPLDENISPRKNMERFYKQMKKQKSGKKKVAEKLTETENRLKQLNQMATTIAETKNQEELEKFWKQLPKKQEQKKQTAKKAGKQLTKSGDNFKIIHLDDGWLLNVGRNDKQNDSLVRHSNGNDLWFHLHQFPGSHVVLKSRGKQAVPPDILAETARVALRHSSKAKDKKGTVIYTEVKNLRRVKGAAAGKVLVTREKTINVTLD